MGGIWAQAYAAAHPETAIEILDLRSCCLDYEAIKYTAQKTGRVLVLHEIH